MGGQLFNADAQAGGCTAKALRAKACGIDGVQQFLFQRCIIRVGVGFVQRAQQCLFGQRCAVVEAAADADAQHDGRAGVGSGLLHRVKHEFFHALDAVGWLEHGKAAHVFTACALGGDGDFAAATRHKMHGQERRGVVPRVDALQRVRCDGLFGSLPNLKEKTDRLHPIAGLMPDPTNLPKGCKFAPRCDKCMEICKEVPPEVYVDGTHSIRCHLYCQKKED